MTTETNRTSAAAAAMRLLLVLMSVLCAASSAEGACLVSAACPGPLSITIRAPLTVDAGGTLCFEVVSYSGSASVTVELNEVQLPSIEAPTGGPGGSSLWCFKIPPGTGGSTVVITAVGPDGSVATATVVVH
jgi:hypothetical protein